MAMVAETFRRDLRIGLRVLVKERVVLRPRGHRARARHLRRHDDVQRRQRRDAARLLVSERRPAGQRQLHRSVERQRSSASTARSRRWTSRSCCREQQSFELLAAYLNGSTVNVTVNGKPQRYTGAYVTEHFLRILGMSPMLGRDFTPADNTAGAEKVAIIGYGIWQRDFGGAPTSSARASGSTASRRRSSA